MEREQVHDVIVVGGGAAGFFAAIEVVRRKPDFQIEILERSKKVLSKVRVSGGGRCNVTHNEFNPIRLSQHYPRGERWLRNPLKQFQASDMIRWLGERGVEVHAEPDGRVFPVTNSSETIINCFLRETSKRKIRITTETGVERVQRSGDYFEIVTQSKVRYFARKILIAVGGNPAGSFYDWIRNLGHTISRPLPSLFTFNTPAKSFTDLMGVSVSNATVRIGGTKMMQQGPVLITHWGLSGPAVIKLSAWAAEYLNELNYRFTLYVNWTGNFSEDEMRSELEGHRGRHGRQIITKNPLFSLPSRLWQRLCDLAEIEETKTWQDVSRRCINKLLENLIRCSFEVAGKTTFKEEFVTCGGVDLNEIDPTTMESRLVPNLFFAGEVMNIDGETGGFNFQAAWTTGYLAAAKIADE